MSPWLLAARPKTLPAALAPVAAGTALGCELAGAFHPGLALLALASCLCLQISTNLFNDAIDHRKGADTAARLGPTRVTASGLLSPRQVMAAALIFMFGAGVCAVPLYLARGWPIIALGIPSLYLCYGYTGGPWPLAYRGLGDLFVLVFFGWVAVVGSTFLQTGLFHWHALLLGTQIGLLSTSLIAINNLRDREEDSRTGKRTLAVRFGETFARWEIACCLFLPYLLGIGWLLRNDARTFPLALGLPLFALPLAISIASKVRQTAPGPSYNRFLALSAAHLMLFSVLVLVGVLR